MILNDKKISDDVEIISSALKNNTHALLAHSKHLSNTDSKIEHLYDKVEDVIADYVSIKKRIDNLECQFKNK